MKTLVSDMGGILYSFDPSFDPQKHQKAFDSVMKQLGKSEANLKDQLQGELDAVESGFLKIYPHQKGIENFSKNLKSYHGVIIATSVPATTQYILHSFGIPIDNLDIFDMSDYGSKKDKEAWRRIFKQYPTIDVIVEDDEKNLEAAGEAARELGFSSQMYQSMPLLDL